MFLPVTALPSPSINEIKNCEAFLQYLTKSSAINVGNTVTVFSTVVPLNVVLIV